jgi:hypothetical protein
MHEVHSKLYTFGPLCRFTFVLSRRLCREARLAGHRLPPAAVTSVGSAMSYPSPCFHIVMIPLHDGAPLPSAAPRFFSRLYLTGSQRRM